MPEATRVVVSPVRLLGRQTVASVVAADAVARHAHGSVCVAGLTSDLISQFAVEREVARLGEDGASLDVDQWTDHARALEGEAIEALQQTLAGLAIGDLTIGRVDDDAVLAASRAGFVRLYEAGLLGPAERVVPRCPRCRTVVDQSDVEPGELEGELTTVEIPLADGGAVTVRMHELELLPGAAALVVPDHDDAAGGEAVIPLRGAVVPVLGGEVDEPRVLVPGHDQAALDVAWARGFDGPVVLDASGVVELEGSLQGLARFAAREAARQLLTAEGAVTATEPATETVGRCLACGTVVVPVRTRQWFLDVAALEVQVADAIRNGAIACTPAGTADRLLELAAVDGRWCLSTQLPAGPRLPVGTCRDCGQDAVEVEPRSSCRKCMGPIEPSPDGLDARFLAAMWGLVVAGPGAVAMCGPEEVGPWALRTLALGLHLNGTAAFGRVAVHAAGEVTESDDPRIGRVACLVADHEAGAALIAAIDRPALGDGDVVALAEAVDAALDEANPSAALDLISIAANRGVPASDAAVIRSIASPLCGP